MFVRITNTLSIGFYLNETIYPSIIYRWRFCQRKCIIFYWWKFRCKPHTIRIVARKENGTQKNRIRMLLINALLYCDFSVSVEVSVHVSHSISLREKVKKIRYVVIIRRIISGAIFPDLLSSLYHQYQLQKRKEKKRKKMVCNYMCTLYHCRFN